MGTQTRIAKLHRGSLSVLHLAKNYLFHEVTKHVATKYDFIHIVSQGDITQHKIHVSKNPANFLTKALHGYEFQLSSDLVNVCYKEDGLWVTTSLIIITLQNKRKERSDRYAIDPNRKINNQQEKRLSYYPILV